MAAQPRFHLEMALLRWVHLRKLVPLAALLDGLPGGGLPAPALAPRSGAGRGAGARPVRQRRRARRPRRSPARRCRRPRRATSAPAAAAGTRRRQPRRAGPPAPRNLLVDDVSEAALARFREAFLGEVKRSRGQADWGMVFLPARRVEVAVGSVTFVYESQPKLMAGALRGAASRAERAGDAASPAGR